MGRGALRFGGKSGVLPKPREIFKQPYKHQVYKQPTDTGYADGILHPKGTSRDYVPPKVFTPERRLKLSAKQPSKQYTESELKAMPAQQRFNIESAEMRRQYLKESYEAEVNRLERKEQKLKEKEEEQREIQREAKKHEQTRAELYTMSTVDSYLKGPFMRERTPEEKLLLQQKREANRLQQELKVKTERAVKLMELYNASASFAITEEKLNLMVDEAFSDRKLSEMEKVSASTPNRLDPMPSEFEFETNLKDAILGNANKGPSFEVVEDTLLGATEALNKEAEISKEKKKEELKLEALEKQKKLQELQEEMIKEREQLHQEQLKQKKDKPAAEDGKQ
ncbi:unnamed protein product [Ambrosiozyma monospora]|uniref:Unnamed protein product n=1 Tax=Ambrosiozyma monospora TaxID=43982 RepID=A0ACB5T9B7_AMBMO|nr:unnamed protein product [Ambrosiozyma monospora]